MAPNIVRFICCFLWIAFPGVIVLIIILAINASKAVPRCYIQELYVPSLDLSLETTTSPNSSSTTFEKKVNPSIFFDIALKNVRMNCDVLYNDIKLTFSYGNQSDIASHIISGFYQGDGETTHRRGVVETHGVPWDDALRAVSDGSKVVFFINVTAVRPLFFCWNSDAQQSQKIKGRHMDLWTGVEVDKSGMKVQEEYIRLASATSKSGVGTSGLFLLMMMSLVFTLS